MARHLFPILPAFTGKGKKIRRKDYYCQEEKYWVLERLLPSRREGLGAGMRIRDTSMGENHRK